MTRTPTISCVLPTHNGRKYLDQSVQSVVDQTFTDWELILVDDGSTDDTPEKIRAWTARDPRIKAVTLSQNRKLPGALNEGFRHASGELFTWTSDDNWYEPAALAEMHAVLERRDDMAVVYADMNVIEEHGWPGVPFQIGRPEDLAFENFFGGCFLYRREVHEALGGYDEALFLVEDYDFWLRASNRFRLEPIFRRLYNYRRHGGSLTAQKSRAVAMARETALARWLPTAECLDPGRRLAACVHWAIGTFALDPSRNVFQKWREEYASQLGPEFVQSMRAAMIEPLVEMAKEHAAQRRWNEFWAIRAFLAEDQADPRAAAFLAMPIRPRWYYAVKDCAGEILAAWKDRRRAVGRNGDNAHGNGEVTK